MRLIDLTEFVDRGLLKKANAALAPAGWMLRMSRRTKPEGWVFDGVARVKPDDASAAGADAPLAAFVEEGGVEVVNKALAADGLALHTIHRSGGAVHVFRGFRALAEAKPTARSADVSAPSAAAKPGNARKPKGERKKKSTPAEKDAGV